MTEILKLHRIINIRVTLLNFQKLPITYRIKEVFLKDASINHEFESV